LETWRTEWLEHLEYGSSKSFMNPYRIPRKEIYLGCMRNFGSVDDILAMIEEGDQDKDLQPRINAIRGNRTRMQALREVWEDKRLDELVEGFIRKKFKKQ
jgi:hypothetical protein